MFLVDTDILSASSPARVVPSRDLAGWMDTHTDLLFVSTVTVAEIEDGIAKARREKASRKAAALDEWLRTLLHLYSNRVLAFDLAAAHAAGILSDRARAGGHAPGFADIAIAATAMSRKLTILTRNLRHFAPLGVPAHDPFDRLPPT